MASPTGISIKRIGLIASAILALLFIAVIVIAARMTPKATPGSTNDFLPDPGDIADIERTQSGGEMFVTIVDQNDPTRVSSTLRATRFEPIGEGRRRLDQPESWIYLRDGRAIRVNADYATMLMPDPNQPPESGTLEGNILIRAYESTPAPGSPAPEDQEPTLVARFDEPLEFERRYLRMRTPGRFRVESRSVDFTGSDLTVIVNNLRNRIELLDVGQGERLVIHTRADDNHAPQAHRTRTETKPQSATDTDTEDGRPTAAPDTPEYAQNPTAETPPDAGSPTEPDIERYRIQFQTQVHAQVGDIAQARADAMTLWAAIIDGRLPPDALRRVAFAENNTRPQSPPGTQGEQQAVPRDRSPQSAPDANTPGENAPVTIAAQAAGSDGNARDIVITWTGPMRVRPIDDEVPDELKQDHLALRLDSEEGSEITISAPAHRFSGQAKRMTYYASRGVVDLRGDESTQGVVRLVVEDTGTLYAEALQADLTSGLVRLNRRGTITTNPDDPEKTASVQWKSNASIRFALDERGALTQRLAHARFEGAAIAKQKGNSIGARVIDATLDPDLPPVSALRTLALTEGVISSADKQMLSGHDLTITFQPDPDGASPPHPVRVSAVGASMGRTPEAMLRADEMHADLFRDEQGSTRIRTATARGTVRYRDNKRTSASADTLQADALEEVITLTGPDTSVTQAGSTIAGEHITLRARRRSIEVTGPGTFEHDVALAESEHALPGQKGQVKARWNTSMRFEDTLGTIECTGAVRVISTPDALTRDTLKADRITINLTPMPTTDRVDNKPAPQRQLISARADGRAEPGKDPEPASIESRSYSPNNPELALGVLYLEGPQIIADNQKQTLTVPGTGTLLVLDRQTDQQDPDTPRSGLQAFDGSGLTRFTWNARMHLDRTAGQGQFTGSVQVDHKPLFADKIARLQTDTLTAIFDTGITDPTQPDDQTPLANDSPERGITLRGATATGNVRFRYEGRELLSDNAHYDAIADSLFASAVDNKLVTLYDDRSTTPVSARTMRWDLRQDRIEFDAPSPVRTTPDG